MNDPLTGIDYCAWANTLRRKGERAKDALRAIPKEELDKMSNEAKAAVMVAMMYLGENA